MVKKIVPPSHIVLGGGGIKCLSYVGAFQELELKGLLKTIKNFHGVSAGAFMCFVYVLGYSLSDLYNIAKSMDFSLVQNIDENFPLELFHSFGFDNGLKLEKLIESFLKHKGLNKDITFKQLYELKKTNLVFYAVDINEGILKELSYKKTPDITILFGLRASMSLPGYFTPVIEPISNHYYVDGALLNNYPIELINESTVIGINFKDLNIHSEKIESIQSYFYQLFSCLYNKFQEIPESFKNKTIYIECKASTLDFFATEEERIEIIEIGREAVKKYFEYNINDKSFIITRRNSI